MADTAENSRKLQIQPFVTANLKENEIDVHFIDLIIENIGEGIAKNVQFQLQAPDTIRVPSKWNHKIEEIELFRRGIHTLGPHQSMRFIITNLHQIVGPEEKHISDLDEDKFKFTLTITYMNLMEENCPPQEYILDLLIFWGLIYIKKPALSQIVIQKVTEIKNPSGE